MKTSTDHILYEKLPGSNKVRYYGIVQNSILFRGIHGLLQYYLIPDYILDEAAEHGATTVRLMDSAKLLTYYESSLADWRRKENMYWLSRRRMIKIFIPQEQAMRRNHTTVWYLRK